MAILNETKFSRELIKQLYPENSFYTKGKVDFNQNDAKTIKYPVAATIGSAKTGSPSLPLSIETFTDGQDEYTTEQVYAGPVLINNEQEMLTNYSIFQDRVSQLAQTLNTKIANLAAYQWGPTKSDRIALTTGTDTRTTSLTGSASGARKRITKSDIIKIYTAMKKDNMGPGNNTIYGLFTPEMYEDLLLIDDFIDYEKTGQVNNLKRGIVGRILGIEIMMRWDEDSGSAGLWYSQAKAKKDNTTDPAANDGAAALFFKAGAVRYSRAKKVDTSINRKAAGYLGGTIIENWTRFGGAISRQDDEKGVFALVEATT